jgi:hypothetical protein
MRPRVHSACLAGSAGCVVAAVDPSCRSSSGQGRNVRVDQHQGIQQGLEPPEGCRAAADPGGAVAWGLHGVHGMGGSLVPPHALMHRSQISHAHAPRAVRSTSARPAPCWARDAQVRSPDASNGASNDVPGGGGGGGSASCGPSGFKGLKKMWKEVASKEEADAGPSSKRAKTEAAAAAAAAAAESDAKAAAAAAAEAALEKEAAVAAAAAFAAAAASAAAAAAAAKAKEEQEAAARQKAKE